MDYALPWKRSLSVPAGWVAPPAAFCQAQQGCSNGWRWRCERPADINTGMHGLQQRVVSELRRQHRNAHLGSGAPEGPGGIMIEFVGGSEQHQPGHAYCFRGRIDRGA